MWAAETMVRAAMKINTRTVICFMGCSSIRRNSGCCVSDPLARFARVSPSVRGRAAEGGRGSPTRHLELRRSSAESWVLSLLLQFDLLQCPRLIHFPLLPLQCRTKNAVPPHDSTGDEEYHRYEPQHSPESLDRPSAKPSEMKTREPSQEFIAKSNFVVEILRWLQIVDDILKRIGKGKIHTGYRPHQYQQKTPKAHRAMQVPVEELPIRFQIHCKTTSPIRHSRPPYNKTGQTEHRQKYGAHAVHFASRLAVQQIVVQGGEPDHEPHHGRIGRSNVLSRVRIEKTVHSASVAITCKPDFYCLLRSLRRPNVSDGVLRKCAKSSRLELIIIEPLSRNGDRDRRP